MANFLDKPTEQPQLRNHIPEIAQAQEVPPDTALADRDLLVAQIVDLTSYKEKADKLLDSNALELSQLNQKLSELQAEHATLVDEHERLLLAYNKEGETEAETANTEPPTTSGKSGKKHR